LTTIKPFRGVRYNLQKIPDLSAVISQPHDRVESMTDQYYDLSPYNVIRLIKCREQPGDGERDNVYSRARDTYHTWLQEGILIRDRAPALYILRQTFRLPDGRRLARQGLIAAMELTRFDEGIVLPHERTLSGSRRDRLNLLRSVATNFSSVFILYPGGSINDLVAPITEQPPVWEARELLEHEVLQQFWVVTEPEVIAAVAEELAPRRNLIIADGHHRYETSLAYRDEMRAQYPEAPLNAGFNYRSVVLVSMDDPGLVILPTHRLVHADRRMSGAEVLERAKAYFEVTPVESRTELESRLKAAQASSRSCFGFYGGTTALFTLRDAGAMDRLAPDRSSEWRRLDAAVLHELFIEQVLGIDKQAVADHEPVEFLRDAQAGYDAVDQGKAEFLLLMNPTRLEQVQACSAAGERMPQKSTDFYPKVISGLVALPVGVEERL
jgi:uncharacterized protein (DUF1015 family)